MSRQTVHGPVGQLAAGDIHNYTPAAKPPPAGAETAIDCPQCRERTWRFTQHCMHCRLDLWLWRGIQHNAAGLLLTLAPQPLPCVGCARWPLGPTPSR